MDRFRLVSGTMPVASLPAHAWGHLAPVYIGGVDGLRREFPKGRFPQLTGIGHRTESPSMSEPIPNFLSLLEETENGWVPARIDPR
jgi:hypothetical protein